MYEETTEKLLEFISKSPTAFQAAEETRRRFLEEGFTELKEEERWELEKGGKYFVMRNHSAIIGFSIPVIDCRRYHIIARHSDSPSFKIKENPEMSVNGAYVKLNVERYGGMILSTWFDRPLSVAGRMIVHKNGKIPFVVHGLRHVQNLNVAVKYNRCEADRLVDRIDLLKYPDSC